MKKNLLSKSCLLGATIGAAILVAGCNKPVEKADAAPVAKAAAPAASGGVTLETDEQKVTYIVGYRIASQAKSGGFELDSAVMTAAMEDVFAGKEPRIAPADQPQIMREFQTTQDAKRRQIREA